MIMSRNPKKEDCPSLQRFVLVCMMVMLLLGLVSAQDYDAVNRRLSEAVSNGEVSLEQASIMMDALRKAGGAKKQIPKTDEVVRKQSPKTRSGADLDGVQTKLQAMVEAGEITKDQAIAVMSAIKNQAAKRGIHRASPRKATSVSRMRLDNSQG